ncbi:hypothetical protein D7030_07530 [Flavobacteriaceae bacterium AU392]|nr:hypothetical protein D1817_00890 [Flavobacteriaceae bacterium]RKM84973.1 hypothetical protein D7030_07530 [Flavobacteriaceae bacterium AU392]
MKHVFKPLTYLLVLLTFFTSCVNDDSELFIPEESITEQNSGISNIKVEILNENQINSNSIILEELENVIPYITSNNRTSQTQSANNTVSVANIGFNFNEKSYTIFKNEVSYITQGEYHSYTFSILSSEPTTLIENLVLSLNKEGEYDAYVVSYDLTEEQKEALSNQELNDLNIKPSFTSIEDFNINSLLASSVIERDPVSGYCYEVTTEVSPLTGWVITTRGDEEVPCPNEEGEAITVLDDGSDPSGGDGSTGGGGISGGSDPDPYDNDNGDVGFGGGGPSGGGDGDPVITRLTPLNYAINVALILGLDINDSDDSEALNYLELNPQEASSIYQFLESEDATGLSTPNLEAKTEARMRIDAERAQDGGWILDPGAIPNRPSLAYTHSFVPRLGERMYLLENGLVYYQSSTERVVNKRQLNTIASSEVSTDGFNYIYSYNTQRWYEYRLPEPTYADTDLSFLFNGFWRGVKIAGRYATPIEDIVILIDGKDFDGVEQSRVRSAGFLLLEIVPGTGLLRPISRIAENTQVWKVLVKIGDGTRTVIRTVRAITEEVYQKFYNFVVNGTANRALIDDLIRSGNFIDTDIIEVSEKVEDLSIKKGRRLTWEEVKAFFKRGNDFNKKAVNLEWYDYHEIHLANGKRLDSYDDVAGEIISRKATDLENIRFETFENYLREMHQKYPAGTEIRSLKYSELRGQFLIGQQILEIPASNQNFFDIQRYIDFARDNYDIIIRFRPE